MKGDIIKIRQTHVVSLLASVIWAGEGEFIFFVARFRSFSPTVGLKKKTIVAV
jgi:hypothetical protein